MNLSSTVLLSCVLLSGLWGYDQSDGLPLAKRDSSEDACVLMSQENDTCNKSASEKTVSLFSP
jgi:hypothetical protein